jgi:hypothetical protein
MDKWLIYESEKKKIQASNPDPDEYDKKIKELCIRLKI